MRQTGLRNKQRVCHASLTLLGIALGSIAPLLMHKQVIGDELPFLLGGDISALSAIEQHGGVFRHNGQPQDVVKTLGDYGCNCMRLRLFVKPNYRNVVVNDLPYTLALAKRIKKAGQKLILNFHYSDTWADPGKQYKPVDWKDYSFDELEKVVEEYTASSIKSFKDEGVLPDIVQVGNEITPGMLWPEGKLAGANASEQLVEQQWDRFTRLVKAGIRGVRTPLEDTDNVTIMIHIDRGGDWTTTKWFLDNFLKRNVDFELIGQSYYPWWHGTLDDLRDNLRRTAEAYGKPIAVVETSYPYDNPQAWTESKNMAWPVSAEGQAMFLEDLVSVVEETPRGLGAGVIYWYPEAIRVDGLHVWHGGEIALFDAEGEPLPSLEVFRKHSRRSAGSKDQ